MRAHDSNLITLISAEKVWKKEAVPEAITNPGSPWDAAHWGRESSSAHQPCLEGEQGWNSALAVYRCSRAELVAVIPTGSTAGITARWDHTSCDQYQTPGL